MKNRIDILAVLPNAYKAMYGLVEFLEKSSLTKIEEELIKIRASQINQCAYCINMHTKDALKYGEKEQRIFLLNAWRETDLFSKEERALLAVTEEVTLISERGLTQDTYQTALSLFGEQKLAEIIMAVVTINGWNRIAVSTQKALD